MIPVKFFCPFTGKRRDRKSTRLNSSHVRISYAVFCLKKVQLLPLFMTSRKVVALELRAHGRTIDSNAPESFDQDADDVAGLLDYFFIAKADILGFSIRGSTALKI